MGRPFCLTYEEKLKHALAIQERAETPQDHNRCFSMWDKLSAERPDHPVPICGMGTALAAWGHDGAAINMLMRAVAVAPDFAPAWANLGSAFKRQQHTEAARHAFREGIAHDPKNVYALNGMAGSYVNMGEPGMGLHFARRAMAVSALPEVRNNLALLLLENGDWEEGFRHYANRFTLPKYHVRPYPFPQWDGSKIDDTLFLHPEQGVGDEILFATALPEILDRAPKIVAECMPRLLELFRRSFPSIEWYGSHEDVTASEAFRSSKPQSAFTLGGGLQMNSPMDARRWYRLADLPGLLGWRSDAHRGGAVLTPDPVKVAGWRARLAALGPAPHIGFAWYGGTAATHNAVRNAPLKLWSDLIHNAPGTKVSVMYGERGAADAPHLDLTHWPAGVDDLDEFAALIYALDLVVSCPQTAVHFAGALGKQCWVLQSKCPSWQFGQSGDRMAFYRSVRLFRATKGWEETFKNVADALGNFADSPMRDLMAA